MKKLNPLNFYLLRTPTFPFQNLTKLNGALEIVSQEKRNLELKDIFSNIVFKNAIYLASNELYGFLEKWLQHDLDNKSEEKLVSTLHKYYSRMCSRSTPYGLFAGYSSGTISSEVTDIALLDSDLAPNFRIDMQFLDQLKKYIVDDNSLKESLHYYPNNTIYEVGNSLRYVEYYFINNIKKYRLSELSKSEVLHKVLQFCENGVELVKLIDYIATLAPDASPNQIREYAEQLVTTQTIVDRLSPKLTLEVDPYDQLLQNLRPYVDIDDLEILKPLNGLFNNYQYSTKMKDLVKATDFYKEKMDNYNIGHIVQVDLVKKMESNNLNERVINQIILEIEELMNLENRKSPHDLLEFKNRFYRKFEEEEIPLTHALDIHTGVGYGSLIDGNVESSPLLDNVPTFSSDVSETEVKQKGLSQLIINKINSHTFENDQKLIITEEDVKGMSDERRASDQKISNYYIIGSLLGKSGAQIDDSNFKFLLSGNAPSPYLGNLLSRFASSDSTLKDNLKKYFDESNLINSENVIFAEVIHQPNERIGNILIRPNFYKYEIPYLSDASVDSEYIIPITDIMVSVRNNAIVLRSKKFNKEIVPHLTSAHNYSNEDLPIFRFMCDLQLQKVNNGFNWDWSLFPGKTFRPRIEYKNLIISQACWNIKQPNKDMDVKNYIHEFILEYNLPQYCFLAEGDNQLIIDITNPFSLQHIYSALAKDDVIIYEYLNIPENNFIKKSGESYTSEMIIPIARTTNPFVKKKFLEENQSNVQRIFFPGEQWAYYKIYSGNLQADEILSKIAEILTDEAVKEKISSWFFIRYQDPDNHLRVRFKFNEDTKYDYSFLSEKILQHTSTLRDSRLISDITINTYKREIERYNACVMIESEEIFCNDSEAIIEVLKLVNSNENEHMRWKAAVLTIDCLLNDFQLTLQQKNELLKELCDGFILEFIDTNNEEFTRKLLKVSLDKEYREKKSFLEDYISKSDMPLEVIPYIAAFKKRSQRNQSIVCTIQNKINPEEIHEILKSYIHMSLNRLFISKQRKHELVIYYFMAKMYNSTISRQKKKEVYGI